MVIIIQELKSFDDKRGQFGSPESLKNEVPRNRRERSREVKKDVSRALVLVMGIIDTSFFDLDNVFKYVSTFDEASLFDMGVIR